MQPTKALILRTAGTNCELELAHAFELAGATVEMLHINRLIDDPSQLASYQMLGLPGGFSYGDDIAAGRIYANRLRANLLGPLNEFVAANKPVIGICNGFQVLVKLGLLPGGDSGGGSGGGIEQTVTLTDNTHPQFLDRWVDQQVDPTSCCIWTKGLDQIELPIAHGEGRFMAEPSMIQSLKASGQIALRYVDNPNGSVDDIAGICNAQGTVFGLMPHPERFVEATQHPTWTRQAITSPSGLVMFKNAVAFAASL